MRRMYENNVRGRHNLKYKLYFSKRMLQMRLQWSNMCDSCKVNVKYICNFRQEVVIRESILEHTVKCLRIEARETGTEQTGTERNCNVD